MLLLLLLLFIGMWEGIYSQLSLKRTPSGLALAVGEAICSLIHARSPLHT